MPTLIIKTNLPSLKDESISRLHKRGVEILSEILGKSPQYIMVLVEHGMSLSFAGCLVTPCAYLEVKNVGELTPEVTNALSAGLSEECSSALGINPNRIYTEFQQSQRHMWGWNGSTFA